MELTPTLLHTITIYIIGVGEGGIYHFAFAGFGEEEDQFLD